MANSYNMYIHNMPRDSPSRLRRKPCSRTMRGMREHAACENTPCDNLLHPKTIMFPPTFCLGVRGPCARGARARALC